MQFSVYTVWQICEDLSVKHGTGNTISPDQFNRQLALQPLKYFEVNAKSFEENYRFTETLSPFKVSVLNAAIDSNGKLTIPDDYCHFASLLYRYTYTNKHGINVPKSNSLSLLPEAKFKSRLNHSYKHPSGTKPIVCMQDGCFQFAVASTPPAYGNINQYGKIDLEYLRYPAVPVLGYTTDADDNIIYDTATSTQFDFKDIDIMKIIPYILFAIGERLDAEYIQKFAAQYIGQDANI